MTPKLRPEWICSGCEMRVYNPCHDEIPAPTGWVGDLCLPCARKDEDPHDRARRELLTGKSPSRIMVRGVSKKWLRDTREELIESGDLDPDVKIESAPAPKPEPERKSVVTKSPSAARAATDELLRAEPALPNKVVAERAGASVSLVKSRRRALGLGIREQRPERRSGPKPKPKWTKPADLSHFPADALGRSGPALTTVGST